MPKAKSDYIPDEVITNLSEEIFNKQFKDRNCISVNGEIFEIMEGSVYNYIKLKRINTPIKKSYYIPRR